MKKMLLRNHKKLKYFSNNNKIKKMQTLPIEIEKEVISYLNLQNIKKMLIVNKYYNSNLKKQKKIISANIIKSFFKNIKIPTEIEDTYDETKITSYEWVKIYYFYYPKTFLKSELRLIVMKIRSFFGEKRSLELQEILDKYSHLSDRYKLVNCLKKMSKEEIETVGW